MRRSGGQREKMEEAGGKERWRGRRQKLKWRDKEGVRKSERSQRREKAR